MDEWNYPRRDDSELHPPLTIIRKEPRLVITRRPPSRTYLLPGKRRGGTDLNVINPARNKITLFRRAPRRLETDYHYGQAEVMARVYEHQGKKIVSTYLCVTEDTCVEGELRRL